MLLLIRASGLHLRGDEASNQNTEAKGKSFPTLPTKPVVIICLSHEINLSLVHYFDSQTMAKQICSFELFERIRIGVSVHKLKKPQITAHLHLKTEPRFGMSIRKDKVTLLTRGDK